MKIPRILYKLEFVKHSPILERQDFLWSFHPIFTFIRAFGSMGFSITPENEAKITVCDFFWCIVSMCIYSVMIIVYYQNMQVATLSRQSFTLVMGNYLRSLTGLSLCLIKIPVDIYNRFRIVNIMKEIIFFDNEVNPLYSLPFNWMWNWCEDYISL